MDLTNYVETNISIKNKTILTACFRLDKKTMIQMLSAEKIYFNGKYYKTPEYTVLHLLLNRNYGNTNLELEEID